MTTRIVFSASFVFVLNACSSANVDRSADPIVSNTASSTAPDAATPSLAGMTSTQIGDDGKLTGAFTGYAWVNGSPKTSVLSPSPCNNSGCFKATHGQLCIDGSEQALTCTGVGTPDIQCDWTTLYGVMIGMNVGGVGVAWGPSAPKQVAFAFKGADAEYPLTAHVAGDPDSKVYCLENYHSHEVVSPTELRSECWNTNGVGLANFESVDKFTLVQLPTLQAQTVNYCITDLATSQTAQTHTHIANDGRLTGVLNGYAWVNGSSKTTIATPSPCTDKGCFTQTNGKLCTRGTIAPLSCQNAGTPQFTCDWATHYGVMIGMNPAGVGVTFGASAPAHLAVDYQASAGTYRLTAHVAGDPDNQIYCIDNYQSGAMIQASDLKKSCWQKGGAPLASFANVDRLTLMMLPTQTELAFDYCVTDVVSE